MIESSLTGIEFQNGLKNYARNFFDTTTIETTFEKDRTGGKEGSRAQRFSSGGSKTSSLESLCIIDNILEEGGWPHNFRY